MRVALLTTNLQPDNGWATLAVKRGAALQQLGVEVVALTSRGDAPPQAITPERVHAVLPRRLTSGAALDLLRINPLVSRLTADCDLIDVIAEPAALGCLSAALSRPVVATACGSYIPKTVSTGPLGWGYRQLFKRIPIHAISAYTAGRVASALGGPPPPVIIPGVDFDAFQAARPRPEKSGPTVLAVGAVKKRKGIHILVDAIALARQSIPDIRCVVVGKVSDRGFSRKLRERIAARGLDDRVTLAGHLPYEEIVGWYQSADVFAMPSLTGKTHFEGFGLVILEANACGLPAIGTRDSGNASAIVDGETGFLVEQNNAEALAARIVQMIQDKPLRDHLSEGARRFARAQSWARSAAETLSFYEQVLAERRKDAR